MELYKTIFRFSELGDITLDLSLVLQVKSWTTWNHYHQYCKNVYDEMDSRNKDRKIETDEYKRILNTIKIRVRSDEQVNLD